MFLLLKWVFQKRIYDKWIACDRTDINAISGNQKGKRFYFKLAKESIKEIMETSNFSYQECVEKLSEALCLNLKGRAYFVSYMGENESGEFLYGLKREEKEEKLIENIIKKELLELL